MSLPALCAAAVFLVFSVITGLFGFGVVSDEAPLAPKLFCAFFLLSAAAALWWSRLTRARSPTPRSR